MKWCRPIYVGVVSDDGGLQLMKKTGVKKFSKLRTFKGTMYVNYQNEENEGNLDIGRDSLSGVRT